MDHRTFQSGIYNAVVRFLPPDALEEIRDHLIEYGRDLDVRVVSRSGFMPSCHGHVVECRFVVEAEDAFTASMYAVDRVQVPLSLSAVPLVAGEVSVDVTARVIEEDLSDALQEVLSR